MGRYKRPSAVFINAVPRLYVSHVLFQIYSPLSCEIVKKGGIMKVQLLAVCGPKFMKFR